MAEQVLNVTGLAARVEDKQLLHGVDLTINKGETHVLMGPNGAGKSTLGYVLMGAPKYTVTGGQILFKGEDITHESTDKRAKAGMFLSFQEPLEVPGLTLEGFIRSALQQKVGHVRYYDFKKELARCMDILQMDGRENRAVEDAGRFIDPFGKRWFFRRRKEKGRDFAADDAQALPRHSGRDGLRPGC